MVEKNIDELGSYLSLETSSDVISSFFDELTDELIEHHETIELISFQNLFDLPLIITEKLYYGFSQSSSFLTYNGFIQRITSLFSQDNFNLTLKSLFNLFDFNHDGLINPKIYCY